MKLRQKFEDADLGDIIMFFFVLICTLLVASISFMLIVGIYKSLFG